MRTVTWSPTPTWARSCSRSRDGAAVAETGAGAGRRSRHRGRSGRPARPVADRHARSRPRQLLRARGRARCGDRRSWTGGERVAWRAQVAPRGGGHPDASGAHRDRDAQPSRSLRCGRLGSARDRCRHRHPSPVPIDVGPVGTTRCRRRGRGRRVRRQRRRLCRSLASCRPSWRCDPSRACRGIRRRGAGRG